jgi:hypothetical protein
MFQKQSSDWASYVMLGCVFIVGVSLVVLSKGRVPSILGTTKLGIILWDLVYHGHYYE